VLTTVLVSPARVGQSELHQRRIGKDVLHVSALWIQPPPSTSVPL
jgi:hypothetical protein